MCTNFTHVNPKQTLEQVHGDNKLRTSLCIILIIVLQSTVQSEVLAVNELAVWPQARLTNIGEM